MKYNVGDKVKIKSLDWYNENKDEYGRVNCPPYTFFVTMCQYCDKTLTINSVDNFNKKYKMTEDGCYFNWTDDMIECLIPALTDDEPQMNRTELIKRLLENHACIEIPTGYQFKDDNGNAIDTTSITIEKIGVCYPKTYEECCKVLGCKADHFFTDFSYKGCDVEISDYEDKIDDLLQNFRKLRYCRDAYWKLCGEEMELGKPWEPDYTDPDQDRYAIANFMGNIEKSKWDYGYSITFVFPTPEMRDAFFNAFKDDIEKCKVLL